MQGEARLHGTRTPTVTLSPLAYDKPSALQGEARLHGLFQTELIAVLTKIGLVGQG